MVVDTVDYAMFCVHTAPFLFGVLLICRKASSQFARTLSNKRYPDLSRRLLNVKHKGNNSNHGSVYGALSTHVQIMYLYSFRVHPKWPPFLLYYFHKQKR